MRSEPLDEALQFRIPGMPAYYSWPYRRGAGAVAPEPSLYYVDGPLRRQGRPQRRSGINRTAERKKLLAGRSIDYYIRKS